MPSKYGNTAFYHSKEWRRVAAAYMSSKYYICERCGKPAQICHHKTWLNGSNVHDPDVALNMDNLEALCISCHNLEHGHAQDIIIFDEAGNVATVKEGVESQEYQKQRDQIDDVVARAKALLSVVSSEEVRR